MTGNLRYKETRNEEERRKRPEMAAPMVLATPYNSVSVVINGNRRGCTARFAVEAKKSLLCISNGHGEDEVAVSILKEITSMGGLKLEVKAIPLVGMGHAYKRCGIATVGPSRNMPSGGFFFMSKLGLLQDIHAGLISLTVLQWKTIQAWAIKNPNGTLLAVGDLFPLFLAWMASRKCIKVCQMSAGSGIKFIFVGTAKSEYYRCDVDNLNHKLGFFDCDSGVYFVSTMRLLTLGACHDGRFELLVKDLGNPMMDNLNPSGVLEFLKKQIPSLCVALLPGSRAPEVYSNWKTILDAVENLLMSPISDQIIFLVPIFSSLEIGLFSKTLLSMGWKFGVSESLLPDIEDSILCTENILSASSDPNGESGILYSFSYKKDNAFLLLTRDLFPDVANLADAAIAMAGTATEQLVGMGKPVFTLSGNGPQYTSQFANAQSRLLGKSVILCSRHSIVGEMTKILKGERFMNFFKENGLKRMGATGASKRIALQIHHLIWHKDSP
ncbi:uncharacterized protein LOC131029577 isoform X2 [Cryptomeria japonica]|uniref:uncharacterized protein LOC131029577 isoform X2 n=1 Tax=Cryptomeria japonica TaxID=3369 RepID=UPI0025AB8ED2|nr:uncharacterized protein LOC131029577 isoform X2 [Cryptomeria japonica]